MMSEAEIYNKLLELYSIDSKAIPIDLKAKIVGHLLGLDIANPNAENILDAIIVKNNKKQ